MPLTNEACRENSWYLFYEMTPPMLRRFFIAAFAALLYLACAMISYFISKQSIMDSRKRSDGKLQQELKWLHEASYGLTVTALDEPSTHKLLTWMEIFCQGQKGQIQLLGKLHWYRLLVSTQRRMIYSSSDGEDDNDADDSSWSTFPFQAKSWLPVFYWAMRLRVPTDLQCIQNNTAPTSFKGNEKLGEHENDYQCWPACVVDALLWATANHQGESTLVAHLSPKVLARQRGQLLLMGILVPQHSEAEIYKLPHTWKVTETCSHLDGTLALPWKRRFVDALCNLALPFVEFGNPDKIGGIQPKTWMERSQLYRMLPHLFLRLGEPSLATRVLLDPFATYFRLFCKFTPEHGTSDNPLDCSHTRSALVETVLLSDDRVSSSLEHLYFLMAQVAWKQRCCARISQRNRDDEATQLKQIALALFHYPKHFRLASRCLEESRLLCIQNLSKSLHCMTNSLRYCALVLWSKRGEPAPPGEKATMSSESLLARRLFALEKEIKSPAFLQSFGMSEWIYTIQRISSEISLFDNMDVQYSHKKLTAALVSLELSHNQLVETCEMLSRESPDLIRET